MQRESYLLKGDRYVTSLIVSRSIVWWIKHRNDLPSTAGTQQDTGVVVAKAFLSMIVAS